MNGHKRQFGSNSGFTLLEILVVMVIAGLMIALIPPMFSGAVSGAQLKGSARDLAIALRETRSQAIIYNAEKLVHLDLEKPRYRVGDGEIQDLPEDVVIAVQLITGDYVEENARHTVRFFPDGSTSGELIRLSGGNRVYYLQLNWLTGNIAISEGVLDAV